MMNQIKKFLVEEEGLTIVEYAVAGGLITLGVVAAFTLLGTTISGEIGTITTTLNAGPN